MPALRLRSSSMRTSCRTSKPKPPNGSIACLLAASPRRHHESRETAKPHRHGSLYHRPYGPVLCDSLDTLTHHRHVRAKLRIKRSGSMPAGRFCGADVDFIAPRCPQQRRKKRQCPRSCNRVHCYLTESAVLRRFVPKPGSFGA